jgi:hypothetical protein
LTGFGIVQLLLGIWDRFHLNIAITLPIGAETYAAYAIRVSLSQLVSGTARKFAKSRPSPPEVRDAPAP